MRSVVQHMKEELQTHCVFFLQNPTLAMQSAMRASSASIRACTEIAPPSAARSLAMAASVTSSLVCEESINDTSVAKRWFYDKEQLESVSFTSF